MIAYPIAIHQLELAKHVQILMYWQLAQTYVLLKLQIAMHLIILGCVLSVMKINLDNTIYVI